MQVYADTNFLTALYCGGPFRDQAAQLHGNSSASADAPGYPVTLIGRLEFVNALQQSVHFTRNGVPGIRLTPERALVIEDLFFQDLKARQILHIAMLSEIELENRFHDLVHRHTAKEGFRTYDILHVSTALALGCDTFWSFDIKARKLAKLEGLAVN